MRKKALPRKQIRELFAKGLKYCANCEEIKPLSGFGKSASAASGYETYCRPCKMVKKHASDKFDGKTVPPEAEARYWANVEKAGPDDCWLWTACKYGKGGWRGYGGISVSGKMLRAHQVAILLDGREIPKWPMVIDHACRERSCVNPRHLRIVTQGENCTILAAENTPARINMLKTVCVKGHPFATESDVVRNARGHRQCKWCYLGRLKHPHLSRFANTPPR